MGFERECGPCSGRGYYGLQQKRTCKVCGGKQRVWFDGNPDDYRTCNRCSGRGHYDLDFENTCETCEGKCLILRKPRAQETSPSVQGAPEQRIEACIREFRTLLSEGVPYHHVRVDRAYRDIKDAVVSVFGADSREVSDFEQALVANPRPGREPSPSVLYPQSDHERSLKATLEALVYLLQRLSPETAAAYAAFDLLAFDLDETIASACVNHFLNGEFRSAVLDACTALRDLVRQRSERDDLDGFDLASTVFSPKKPILAFNACASDTETSEQQGMMHLFQGAFLALRNPRAHGLAPDPAKEAVDYITLLNILAKQLMKARRTT